MDFKTSSYVEDAIVSLASKNIYGYTNTQNGLPDSVRAVIETAKQRLLESRYEEG